MAAVNDEFGRIMAEYYRKRYQQVEPAIDVAITLLRAIREAEPTAAGMDRLEKIADDSTVTLIRIIDPEGWHAPKEP